MAVALEAVWLRGGTALTTATAGTFRSRSSVMRTLAVAMMGTGSSRTMLMGCRGGGALLMSRCAAIFLRQGDADQLFDIAQEAEFLATGHQRNGGAVRAGAGGSAD